MKFSSMNTMLLAIALKQVSGAAVPADIALSERGDVGNAHYYPIAEHERGTVYSNVVPSTKKRSVAGHAVEESDSSSKGAHNKRSEDYKPVGLDKVRKYMDEQGINPNEKREVDTPLEKRDWNPCVACMAACKLEQNGINVMTHAQKVDFCMGDCELQGACTTRDKADYDRIYGPAFPDPPL